MSEQARVDRLSNPATQNTTMLNFSRTPVYTSTQADLPNIAIARRPLSPTLHPHGLGAHQPTAKLARINTSISCVSVDFVIHPFEEAVLYHPTPRLPSSSVISRCPGTFLSHSLPLDPLTPSRSHRGGLKKAASRAGTQLMQKTGHVERTVDREFMEEETRYRTYVCNRHSFVLEAHPGLG